MKIELIISGTAKTKEDPRLVFAFPEKVAALKAKETERADLEKEKKRLKAQEIELAKSASFGNRNVSSGI